MSDLRQRATGFLDFAKGGWAHAYDILDNGRVVGSKSVYCETRNSEPKTTYWLGDRSFATAREFIAAYEASKREAAA
jgi:hypothetical protein